MEGFGGPEIWICFAKSWAVGRSSSAYTSTRPMTRREDATRVCLSFRWEPALSSLVR